MDEALSLELELLHLFCKRALLFQSTGLRTPKFPKPQRVPMSFLLCCLGAVNPAGN